METCEGMFLGSQLHASFGGHGGHSWGSHKAA
jgi:hypothetical protein